MKPGYKIHIFIHTFMCMHTPTSIQDEHLSAVMNFSEKKIFYYSSPPFKSARY